MPERKKVRSGIFYLIKILHQPSSGKSIRTTFFSQYFLGSTEALTFLPEIEDFQNLLHLFDRSGVGKLGWLPPQSRLTATNREWNIAYAYKLSCTA